MATSQQRGYADPPDLQPEGERVPELADCVTAALQLRRWTDALEAPRMDDPGAQVPIADAAGVCVILRRAGRVVGSGTSAAVGGPGDPLMLRRAFGLALSEATGHEILGNLIEQMPDEIGRRLTVELEVAGLPQPLPGASFEHLVRQVRPGLDGFALRNDDRWAMSFPALARSRGGHPGQSRVAMSLVGELGLSVAPWREMVARHNISAFRFATRHLVSSPERDAPAHLIRGQRIVGLGDVSIDAMESAIAALITHLENRLWPSEPRPLGFRGDYDPLTHRYTPLVADPAEQAMVILALARTASNRDLPSATAVSAARLADRAARDLMAEHRSEVLQGSAASAALILAAMHMPPDEIGTEWRQAFEPAVQAVINSFDPELGFRASAEGGDMPGHIGSQVSPHEQALIAWALVRLARHTEENALPLPPVRAAEPVTAARLAVEAAWSSVDEAHHTALLPWIAFAVLELDGRPLADSDRLTELVDVVSQVQVGPGQRPDEPDLEGGFELMQEGRLQVTAQSTRILPLFAAALRSRDSGDADAGSRLLLQTALGVRFLLQLTARDEWLWQTPYREQTRGGVRSATWSAEMPLSAQAIGLLALSETLEGFRASNRE